MLGRRTVSQIAREMGLTRQSVQRTADRLEADGLDPLARRPRLGWGDRAAMLWAALVPDRPGARA